LNFEHSSESHQAAVFSSTQDFTIQPTVSSLKDVRMCFQQPFINFSTLLQGCTKFRRCVVFLIFFYFIPTQNRENEEALLSIQPANPLTWNIILRVSVGYTIKHFDCCLPDNRSHHNKRKFQVALSWQLISGKLSGVNCVECFPSMWADPTGSSIRRWKHIALQKP